VIAKKRDGKGIRKLTDRFSKSGGEEEDASRLKSSPKRSRAGAQKEHRKKVKKGLVFTVNCNAQTRIVILLG